MRQVQRTRALLVAVLAVSAVSHGIAKDGKEDKPDKEPAKIGSSTVLLSTRTCLSTPADAELKAAPEFIGGLVGALLPSLIEKGFDALVGAARKAGEDAETKRLDARKPTYFYTYRSSTDKDRLGHVDLHDSLTCLVVAELEVGYPWDKLQKHYVTEARLKQFIEKNGLDATRGPRFLVELLPVISADLSAFRLAPSLLYYDGPLGGAKARGDKRDLALSVSFSTPAGTVFAASNFLAPRVGPGTLLLPQDLKATSSSWMPLRPLEEATKARIAAHEAQRLKAQGPALRPEASLVDSDPVNVEALVTETADGIKWLGKVADALTASKKDVGAELEKAIIPSKREDAKTQAAVGELDVNGAYLLAELDVDVAEAELAKVQGEKPLDPVKVAQKTRDLRDKQIIANRKAIAAGKKPQHDMP